MPKGNGSGDDTGRAFIGASGRPQFADHTSAVPSGPASGDPGRVSDPSPLDSALSLRDSDIQGMVRRALDRRDVVLAYQPVVDAREPTRIAFHEGLLRVLDDTGRIIPAREFIDACETSEIGRILDVVALEAGLVALQSAPDLRLSINMSARSVGYPRWMQTLSDALSTNPSLGERLIIEITESSAILLPELVSTFMTDLQLKGIAFAMDDFGSGYTSFRYLRDFDFDILKIAGEFASGVSDMPDNRVLFEALVSIARHFDMFTVAEGVERAEDAALLSSIGIDCMQGFVFGAPSIRPPWDTHAARSAG